MHNAPVVGHAPLVVSLSGRPASPAPPPTTRLLPVRLDTLLLPAPPVPPPPIFLSRLDPFVLLSPLVRQWRATPATALTPKWISFVSAPAPSYVVCAQP